MRDMVCGSGSRSSGAPGACGRGAKCAAMGSGTLALRTRKSGDRLVVEIADTGTGLTAEECERLFTPYYTSKAHGTGLGLAIVQSIISDHGGKISVRSQPGSGTTFMIELPGNLNQLTATN